MEIGIWIFLFCCMSPLENCSAFEMDLAPVFEICFENRDCASFHSLCNAQMQSRTSLVKLEKGLAELRLQVGAFVKMKCQTAGSKKHIYILETELGEMEIHCLFDSNGCISEMSMGVHVEEHLQVLNRNRTSLNLPFDGEWYVFWGGQTARDNYHVAYPNQKGAYDFLMHGPNGKSFRVNGKTNEDYFAFGQDILAPCDGEVIRAIDRVSDNIWPEMNRKQSYGNVVVLKTKSEEFLVFAHLKRGSVAVQQGQIVRQGELLGHCGNSGLSTEPHLHFSIQNSSNMMGTLGAWGYFDRIFVDSELKTDYMPKRGSRVRNVK